jgi:hypothetical protein
VAVIATSIANIGAVCQLKDIATRAEGDVQNASCGKSIRVPPSKHVSSRLQVVPYFSNLKI